MTLRQPVDPVVHDDVGHVHAAAHDVGELAEADRGAVAVAGELFVVLEVGRDVVGVVQDDRFDHTAGDAAVLVDRLPVHLGGVDDLDDQRCEDARQVGVVADLDGLVVDTDSESGFQVTIEQLDAAQPAGPVDELLDDGGSELLRRD